MNSRELFFPSAPAPSDRPGCRKRSHAPLLLQDLALRRGPAPALQKREGGAPATGLLKLGLALLAERRELVGGDQRQQALLEGGGELQRQAEVRMLRRKRQNLGPDVSFDAELAKQVEVLSPCEPVSPAYPKRLHDQFDQPLQRGRRRIEMPGARVGILEHDGAAGPGEAQVRLHLLLG